MIETYKIMTGKYNIQIVPSLVGVSSSVTRGHVQLFEITKK